MKLAKQEPKKWASTEEAWSERQRNARLTRRRFWAPGVEKCAHLDVITSILTKHAIGAPIPRGGHKRGDDANHVFLFWEKNAKYGELQCNLGGENRASKHLNEDSLFVICSLFDHYRSALLAVLFSFGTDLGMIRDYRKTRKED